MIRKQGSERRDRDAGDVLRLLDDLAADLLELGDRAGVEIGEVDLQAAEHQAALPVGQHAQDVPLRAGIVARQLGDLLGDGSAGVEDDEAEDDQRQRGSCR